MICIYKRWPCGMSCCRWCCSQPCNLVLLRLHPHRPRHFIAFQSFVSGDRMWVSHPFSGHPRSLPPILRMHPIPFHRSSGRPPPPTHPQGVAPPPTHPQGTPLSLPLIFMHPCTLPPVLRVPPFYLFSRRPTPRSLPKRAYIFAFLRFCYPHYY